MATVHRERGFTFHVFSNDHQPAHIHVKKDDGEIKIDICDESEVDLLCVKAKMSNSNIEKALDIAESNLKKFRTKWERYHGPIN